MEATGARLVHVFLEHCQAIIAQESRIISAFLSELTACIRELGVLLDRMYERCDPTAFFYGFRPFLAGSMNMAAAGLPNGVFYSTGDGEGKWLKLRGGSNGQSPLVQFLDIILGIQHSSDGNHAAQEPKSPRALGFHEEVRGYMPGPHRRFLERISTAVRIRELVNSLPDEPQHEEVRHAYQAAVRALTEFRNKHLQIVARYIVLPSKLGAPGNNQRS